MIAALVDDKRKLDRAARAIELYRSLYRSDGGACSANVTGVARTFDEAHRVFDARVAALTEDERWQFMFRAMVTGALEDECETSGPRV